MELEEPVALVTVTETDEMAFSTDSPVETTPSNVKGIATVNSPPKA